MQGWRDHPCRHSLAPHRRPVRASLGSPRRCAAARAQRGSVRREWASLPRDSSALRPREPCWHRRHPVRSGPPRPFSSPLPPAHVPLSRSALSPPLRAQSPEPLCRGRASDPYAPGSQSSPSSERCQRTMDEPRGIQRTRRSADELARSPLVV